MIEISKEKRDGGHLYGKHFDIQLHFQEEVEQQVGEWVFRFTEDPEYYGDDYILSLERTKEKKRDYEPDIEICKISRDALGRNLQIVDVDFTKEKGIQIKDLVSCRQTAVIRVDNELFIVQTDGHVNVRLGVNSEDDHDIYREMLKEGGVLDILQERDGRFPWSNPDVLQDRLYPILNLVRKSNKHQRDIDRLLLGEKEIWEVRLALALALNYGGIEYNNENDPLNDMHKSLFKKIFEVSIDDRHQVADKISALATAYNNNLYRSGRWVEFESMIRYICLSEDRLDEIARSDNTLREVIDNIKKVQRDIDKSVK
jgi:hypothetical protein